MATCTSTWPNGSSRAPNFDVVRRTPRATARTRPWRRVNRVMIRSDSPSFCTCSTTASSRYSLPLNPTPDMSEPSESQAPQLLGVPLPVLRDPDVQVEIDPAPDQAPDLPPGAGAAGPPARRPARPH